MAERLCQVRTGTAGASAGDQTVTCAGDYLRTMKVLQQSLSGWLGTITWGTAGGRG